LELPALNIDEIVYLFGVIASALAIFWGINKAIIISKSH
jgi:hypothetical protein